MPGVGELGKRRTQDWGSTFIYDDYSPANGILTNYLNPRLTADIFSIHSEVYMQMDRGKDPPGISRGSLHTAYFNIRRTLPKRNLVNPQDAFNLAFELPHFLYKLLLTLLQSS